MKSLKIIFLHIGTVVRLNIIKNDQFKSNTLYGQRFVDHNTFICFFEHLITDVVRKGLWCS